MRTGRAYHERRHLSSAAWPTLIAGRTGIYLKIESLFVRCA
ncbi:hypothetical protein EMIT0111MI5_180003 [Burkholderia sp. IT-111MI5]